ncbi:unnamed protein product [Urochloa humidicola]
MLRRLAYNNRHSETAVVRITDLPTTTCFYNQLSSLAPKLPWRRAAACLFLLVLLLGIFPCHHVAAARPAPAAAAAAALHRHHPDDGSAWRPSEHLRDAGHGSRVAGLAEVKSYLARFGYMHVHPESSSEHGGDGDAFDEHTEAAVKLYQSRLGLPVSGRLDAATLGRIASPRCGVSDVAGLRGHVSASVSVPDSRFAFFGGDKPRWTRPDNPLVLTYSVSPPPAGHYLPPDAVRAAVRSAFARWARVIPVMFVEVGGGEDGDGYHQLDIRVRFYEGDHGDGWPFDGKGGVVGHAYPPEDGRLHLDAAESWTVDVDSEAAAASMDLESVATHEIGHILGLDHSSSPEAVMYPYIGYGERKVELSVDDIDGAQLLYGSNPRFNRHERHAPAPPQWSDPSLSSASPGRSSWLSRSVSFVGVIVVMLITYK